METGTTIEDVKALLVEVLGIDADRAAGFDVSTPLLGSLPELDSLAVVSLITGIEDTFGIAVDDSDIDAETFETLGTLVGFVAGHRS
jgi:acyl carrier protein